MKVLTIIVSYNFEPWIHMCIPSLLHSTYPTDILVVDNASTDNTIQILKAHYPAVLLIESQENLGFGKANTIGMKYAIANGYTYVYLVNQDAWLDKNCIYHLISTAAPQNAMLSPMHYDGTEKVLDQGFAGYFKQTTTNQTFQKVNFVNAAFWFIPVDIIKRIGLFSPIFYHYGEDKDFTNRLQYHGVAIYVVYEAKAYHDRQNREEDITVNYKREYIYHLTEICNINYPWFQAMSKSIFACYKKAINYLLKGNCEDTKNYLHIASRLWNKISEVKSTRQKNKIIGSYFNS